MEHGFREGGASEVSARRGCFDADGALHLTCLDALASLTRADWQGASLDAEDPGVDARRAHVTCPHCASSNPADADRCWNCDAAM